MSPLSQRIAVLERLWQEFRRVPGARLCRWLFAPDDEWVLAVFLQQQAGPDALSNDIFITLQTPVQHWQLYFDQALADLSELVNHDLALLAEQNLMLRPVSGTGKLDASYLQRFVGYVNQLAQELRRHTDGILVLCLMPQSCASNTVLDQMLTALLMGGLSTGVRLLVTDTIGQERLATLPGRFMGDVYSNAIDLQLQKVISQVAALGSPTAPDVKFRQWQAELTSALTRRNLRDVLYFANKCQLICQQERWSALEGSVHLSVAQAYIDHTRYEDALSRYTLVLDQMEALFTHGDRAAGQLSIMAWLGAGGVYENVRQRQRAVDCYTLASERAETLEVWLLAVESHRRLAVGYKRAGRSRLAETHYLRLFNLAGQLPKEQHQAARLSEIGKDYRQQQHTPEKRRKADELLDPLLGTRHDSHP